MGVTLDIRDILDRYNEAWEADGDNREDAYDDLRFLAGDQWDHRAKREREYYRKPVITINRMGQFVRQVTGDMRLNPTSIRVQPVDDFADIDKAEILEGIIRQIEYASGATNIYAHAFECAVGVGIGHFRVVTQYEKDSVDKQEIHLKRILNPLAVTWDPNAQEIDRSDADYCFVSELMSHRAFKKKYPDANLTDFPRESRHNNLFWQEGDYIRVAEFWHREPYQRTLAMTIEGETIDLTGITKADWKFLPLAEREDGKPLTRTFTDYRIKQYIVSGKEILADASSWAGRYIPIIPAIGSEIPLDEITVRHGLIRYAKDPQRLYNYYRSSQAELISQQPRAPFLVTAKMIKGYAAEWNTANVNPRPYLPYNPDPEAPGRRPDRVQPPTASPALWQEAAIAADDMKATTGIYDAALGAKSNETSGRAILARQREGDVGSYHYFDNFKVAIKRVGDILIDLIPKIYDTERVVRIIGAESDEPQPVRINRQVPGLDEVMNDLSIGKFDVRVTSGPAFSTRREEAREGMTALIQSAPQLTPLIADIYVEAMDFPKAKEMAERIRRTMPPGILEDQQAGPQQPDPMQEEAARIQMAGAEADIQKKQADAAKSAADAEGKQIDNAMKLANPYLAGPGRPPM